METSCDIAFYLFATIYNIWTRQRFQLTYRSRNDPLQIPLDTNSDILYR